MVKLSQYDCAPVALGMPTGWTGASLMSFLGSDSFDAATYSNIYFSCQTGGIFGKNEVILDVGTGGSKIIGVQDLPLDVHFLKVRSGTLGSPIVQAAQQVVNIYVRTKKG